MTKTLDAKTTVQADIELDLYIEEMETFIVPAVATSPVQALDGLFNHNETLVADPALAMDLIEQQEEKSAPDDVIIERSHLGRFVF